MAGAIIVAALYRSGIPEEMASGDTLAPQPQATMLWALEPSSPPVSMRELAHKLHCDPSNITLLGDQLQAAGLVERRPDPTDGRRRILRLTAKGLSA